MVHERVLVVADQESAGQSLQELISHVAPARPVKLASSTAEALTLLTANDFEVVFTDLSAGSAAAIEFLNEAWKLRPTTIRYFCADSVDSQVMISSALGSHHFLAKPLSESSIAGALERADAIGRFVRNDRIQALVSRMRTLPSRPSLYVEVMRELRSPTASAETVAEIVAKDLAISTRLISLVNSAYYARQQKITDPADAVLLLGFETTASLVLSIEAMARFDKVKPLYFSMDRVWKHNQAVAQTARRIAEIAGGDAEIARDAYTAGLLHDIGQLALAVNFEEQYHGALKLAESKQIPPCEVEQQVFGATHAEAGAYLLCVWGLPLSIVESVGAHHSHPSELKPPFSATAALHLAEQLHTEADSGNSESPELEYSSELGINHLVPEFRRLVRGEDFDIEPPKEEPKSGGVQAQPAPMRADAAPAPLLTIHSDGRPTEPIHLYAGLTSLVLILLFAAFLVRKGPATPPERLRAPKPARQVSAVSAHEEQAAQPLPQPQVGIQDVAARIKLQAVLFKGANSSVLINGRSYRLDEEVEGARIVAIFPQSITIQKGSDTLLLSLNAR